MYQIGFFNENDEFVVVRTVQNRDLAVAWNIHNGNQYIVRPAPQSRIESPSKLDEFRQRKQNYSKSYNNFSKKVTSWGFARAKPRKMKKIRLL